MAENTLFLFTSDNGPQFGSEFGPVSLKRFNGNFNGNKGNVYEGGIRVPTLLSWPGGVPGGGRSLSDMVHFTDWLPTFLEAANLSPDENGLPLDGASVLPVLRGDTGSRISTRFWQWNRYTPIGDCNSAMRDGNWKLLFPTIREAMQVTPEDWILDRKLKYEPEAVPDIDRSPFPVPVLPDAPNVPRLFDLNADPYEQTDLSGDNPDRVQAMKTGLAAWFADVEADRNRHSVKEAE